MKTIFKQWPYLLIGFLGVVVTLLGILSYSLLTRYKALGTILDLTLVSEAQKRNTLERAYFDSSTNSKETMVWLQSTCLFNSDNGQIEEAKAKFQSWAEKDEMIYQTLSNGKK